jgi:hypothetical protein
MALRGFPRRRLPRPNRADPSPSTRPVVRRGLLQFVVSAPISSTQYHRPWCTRVRARTAPGARWMCLAAAHAHRPSAEGRGTSDNLPFSSARARVPYRTVSSAFSAAMSAASTSPVGRPRSDVRGRDGREAQALDAPAPGAPDRPAGPAPPRCPGPARRSRRSGRWSRGLPAARLEDRSADAVCASSRWASPASHGRPRSPPRSTTPARNGLRVVIVFVVLRVQCRTVCYLYDGPTRGAGAGRPRGCDR